MKPWCTLAILLLGHSMYASVDVPRTAVQYVQQHPEVFGVHAEDVEELRISGRAPGSGAYSYWYVQQQRDGIDIYNAIATLTLSAQHQVVHATGRLVDSLSRRAIAQATIAPATALQQVTGLMDFSLPAIDLSGSARTYVRLGQTDSIGIRQVWWSATMGPSLTLVYDVEVTTARDVRQYLIRASDGVILRDKSLFVSCSPDGDMREEPASLPLKEAAWMAPYFETNAYNVYPLPVESPAHGTRKIVLNPSDPEASPFGWHDINGQPGPEFLDTKGNNARVQEDTDANDIQGRSADGGDNLVFDFPLDETKAPDANLNAALTNLFFWVNLNHDIFYHYGFDEASGNFQQNNYGHSGIGNDPVLADAMDGDGLNNARFYSPEDGSPGRMEMFLWGSNSAKLNVDGAFGSQSIPNTVESDFSSNNKLEETGSVDGRLVLVRDTGGSSHLGCLGTDLDNAPGDFTGKIALIERGDCFFVEKVLRVQELGAIAAIVVNNINSAPVVMSGSEERITIPAVMIPRINGIDLINALLAGDSITIHLYKDFENRLLDSSLDNLIITHEYGHGVSIRLTGGAAATNCLENDEQMGEGWSDYFGLLFTTNWNTAQAEDRRGVGTWLSREPTDGQGIRPYPYSYSLAIDPLNYSDISNLAVPHGVGTVWCSMLWDMTWEIIKTEGVSNDWYQGTGGNNIALHLVLEALKLQPCIPGFVDGRDAILKADELLYAGKHQYSIWKAFARRGLGAKAEEKSPFSVFDGVANFEMPASFKTKIDVLDARDSLIQVNVVWNSLVEFGNRYFLLERKTGLGNWEEIARVPGLALDLVGRAFRIPDPDVETGKHYTYRLSNVDDNGISTILGMDEVYLVPVVDLVAYPNPVSDGEVKVKIAPSIQGTVELNVFGVDGRRYYHQVFNDPRLLYAPYSIPLPEVGPGMYFVQMISGKEAITRRIQVIR